MNHVYYWNKRSIIFIAHKIEPKSKKMGKQIKTNKILTHNSKTWPINKTKSLNSNLSNFLQQYIRHNKDVSSHDCLPIFHRYIKQCLNVLNAVSQQQLAKTNQMIRICRKCDKWIKIKQQYLQCFSCEDYYHSACVGDTKNTNSHNNSSIVSVNFADVQQGEQDYTFQRYNMCRKCFDIKTEQMQDKGINQDKNKEKQETKLIYEDQKNECSTCKIANIKKKKLIRILRKCLKCTRLYHKNCFGKAKVVCLPCNHLIQQAINMEKQRQKQTSTSKQLTLAESFKRSIKPKTLNIQQFGRYEQNKLVDEDTNCILWSNRKLRHNFSVMNNEDLSFYKKQLLYAIIAKNMEYTEDLQPQNCDLFGCAEDSFDFTIPFLNNIDLKIYDKYKEQPIGPFKLNYHEDMGYDVVTDVDLPKGTLVCEYVGDVYALREEISLGLNDSRMDLKRGKNADQTLMVSPRKYTNIARFINGINPKLRQKQNLQSTRCYIRGKPAVLLLTKRTIKKGQSLRYDYNAGNASQKYDTSAYQ